MDFTIFEWVLMIIVLVQGFAILILFRWHNELLDGLIALQGRSLINAKLVESIKWYFGKEDDKLIEHLDRTEKKAKEFYSNYLKQEENEKR